MQLALSVLEKVINQYWALDPSSFSRLKNFAGKIVKIEITSLPIQFHMIFSEHGAKLTYDDTLVPDVIIKGSLLDFLNIYVSESAPSKLAKIEIIGDVELGQKFYQLLKNTEIDWEEHLSHLIGDVLAHQTFQAGKTIKTWQQQFMRSLQSNLTEYLQEEVRHLPPRAEVEDFFADIRTLATDVDRLEARLNYLKNSLIDKSKD